MALAPRERAHLAGYRAAGIVNGLGIEAFGPHGRNGIFALDLGPIERLSPLVLGRLRWACQVMHLRYCALLQPMLGSVPSLSAREAEVLRWVARGKSNAAIGDILGISAHTVDAHLGRNLPEARGVRPHLGGVAGARIRSHQAGGLSVPVTRSR